MKNFPIIDADGHVTESLESLKKHLNDAHRNRPLFTSEAWDRSFGGTLGKRNEDPKVQLADMDLDGIDIQVVYSRRTFLSTPKKRLRWPPISPGPTTIGSPNFAPPIRAGSKASPWLLCRTSTLQFERCADRWNSWA